MSCHFIIFQLWHVQRIVTVGTVPKAAIVPILCIATGLQDQLRTVDVFPVTSILHFAKQVCKLFQQMCKRVIGRIAFGRWKMIFSADAAFKTRENLSCQLHIICGFKNKCMSILLLCFVCHMGTEQTFLH